MKKIYIVILLSILMASCKLFPISNVPAEHDVETAVAQTLNAFSSDTPVPAQQNTITATKNIQSTPTKTVKTSIPTATIELDNPKTALGNPTWTDDLNSPDSWYQDDDEYTMIEAQDGGLKLTSLQAIGWHGWSMYYHMLDDFYLEANIKTGNCSSSDRYGLVFRSPDYTQGYFYGLTCNGQYMLNKYDGTKFHTIIASKQSSDINAGSGQNNVLGILATDLDISLYINNILLTTIQDSSYDQGTFGVFIAASDTPGFSVVLDTISYWTFNN